MSLSRKSSGKQKLQNSPKETKRKDPEEETSERDEDSTVVGNKDDSKKYFCKLCNLRNSSYAVGLWHNRKDHINSRSHKNAEALNSKEIVPSKDQSKNQLKTKRDESPKEGRQNESSQSIEKSQAESLTPLTKAELDLSYSKFILQYRLPFDIAKPLNAFTQQIASNYPNNVIQEHNVSRKIVAKATRSICGTLKNNLHEDLLASPFSLSIDASSDVHGNSYLAVCAKFLQQENHERPVTKLYSIFPITTSSSGETFYNILKSEILVNEAIRANFVGIVTDDGPNMTGSKMGVAALLKETYTYLVDIKDLSHGLNNVSKKAVEVVDTSVMGIVKGNSSHFHYSTKSTSILRQTLTEIGMKPLEILHLSGTRFLSLRDCLERIIELWPGLENYFKNYGNKTQKTYFSIENELYIRTLSVLVNNIADINEYFQKDSLLYNEVFQKMKHTYITIANIIIKKQERSMEFEKVFQIPFELAKNDDIKNGKYDDELKKILVTAKEFEDQFLVKYDSIKVLITKANSEKKKDISENSIKFLVMCLKQLQKKLPYSNKVLILSQSVFFEEDYDESKWLELKDHFVNIFKTKKQRDDFATGYQATRSESFKIDDDMIENYLNPKKEANTNKTTPAVELPLETEVDSDRNLAVERVEKVPIESQTNLKENQEDSGDEDELYQEVLTVHISRRDENPNKRFKHPDNNGKRTLFILKFIFILGRNVRIFKG